MDRAFKIQLADMRTGILLDLNGRYHTSGEPAPEITATSFDDATESCRSIFDEYPWAECLVTNLVTGERQMLNNPDAKALERFLDWEREKIAYSRWASLPWLLRLLVPSPKLTLFREDCPEDWRANAG